MLILKDNLQGMIFPMIFLIILGLFFGSFVFFPKAFLNFFARFKKTEKVIHLKAGTYRFEEYYGPITNYLRGGTTARVIVHGNDKYVTTMPLNGGGDITLYEVADSDQYDNRYIYVNATDDTETALPWHIKLVRIISIASFFILLCLMPFNIAGEPEPGKIATGFMANAVLGLLTTFGYKSKETFVMVKVLYFIMYGMFILAVLGTGIYISEAIR